MLDALLIFIACWFLTDLSIGRKIVEQINLKEYKNVDFYIHVSIGP
jgi:hypothetical protein